MIREQAAGSSERWTVRNQIPKSLNPFIRKERGHTYTPDNGGAVRLVAAEEMKQSKSVGMLDRELGA
ncbi:MAG: hypothetical protein ACLQJ7_07135 [Syntrophobacteraceae bacterium]